MKYCDPRYDVTFKKVFAQHPDLMISLLNALLPLKGDQTIDMIEYLTPEMIPEMPNAKYSVVDVQCKDNKNQKFLVEMQMIWSEEFKSRVLFNASKAYVSQLEIGGSYKLLQPVYSINIVNDTFETDLPKDEFFHYYQLVHERHTEKIIKGLHIAFIELPKFKPQNNAEKKMFDLWLRFLTEINGNTKEVPEELMMNPLTKKAVTLMEVAGMTEGERYAYWKNIDNVLVEQAIMREAINKGFQQGLQHGIEQGIEQGERRALFEIAKKSIAQGIPIEMISKVTGLAEEEIQRLTDQPDSESIKD